MSKPHGYYASINKETIHSPDSGRIFYDKPGLAGLAELYKRDKKWNVRLAYCVYQDREEDFEGEMIEFIYD